MNRAEAEVLRAECRWILDHDVANVVAWEGLGRAEYELGRFEQARVAFNRAADLDPARAHSWDGLARVEFELKHFDMALAATDRAIELSAVREELGLLWTSKGMTLLRLHRPSEALQAFDAAIET